ncbi:MAG: putative toxin-antitoxin system toxin component, PIN family [Candidatus Doudnabacteria bacterium RIFCSPHIGHO2_02_FULL_46_11]|uniref:Putative toxin-antitoxin system toxin component, PIN family n=1 Tax=Candidatus Doudnabacteria bacterium RIFCSPHIGHO2_02_FULL_46_11 TaxID=1817832 RepID=A0A1F5P9R2_9BACT|nr:MAG: putative toxin-antitoxin system toxin component, PIN family [Candidatus Doudnabacteria bacterium RIFCSPHIGHO2_02_FULL_46_11]
MRLVIDSNVLIDGNLDDNSFANKIIDEVLKGSVFAFVNESLYRENKMIVGREMMNEEYKAKLLQYLDKLQKVRGIRVRGVSRDKEDDKVLASAVAAEAEYIISSDNDLLLLEEYENIPIVSPQQFWNRYKEDVLGENEWSDFIEKFLTH